MVSELAEKEGEFLVFDSDYIESAYHVLSNCSLLRTALCKDFRKIYFTRDPRKRCVCDILVIKIRNPSDILLDDFRREFWCVIYTQDPFRSLEKYLNQNVRYRSLVFDFCGVYLLINTMVNSATKESASIGRNGPGIRKYITSHISGMLCLGCEEDFFESVTGASLVREIKRMVHRARIYKLSGNIKPVSKERQLIKPVEGRSPPLRICRANRIRNRASTRVVLVDSNMMPYKRRLLGNNRHYNDSSDGSIEEIHCPSTVPVKRAFIMSQSSSCPE